MTAHDYYRDPSPANSTYETLHLEVTEACSRIDMIPCSEVSDTMLQIKDGLITDTAEGIEEAWQSDLSASFNSAINKTKSAIDNLIMAVGFQWGFAEENYKTLLEQLEELKTKNEEFKTFVETQEPKSSDSKYRITKTVEVNGKMEKFTRVNDALYTRDHDNWKSDVDTLAQALVTLQSSINEKVTNLQNESFSAESYYSVGMGGVSGSLSSEFNTMTTLVHDNNPYENIFETDNTPAGNMAVAWNFLRYKGLTDVQAAGVLGNMWWEADRTFDPKEENSIGAYGLVQWLGGRRKSLAKYAASKGKTEDDLQSQLEYLWNEGFSENSGYRRALANNKDGNFFTTSSPADAAFIFERQFEKSEERKKPGFTEAHRGAPAQVIYDMLNGKEVITEEDAANAIAMLNKKGL